MNHAINTPSAWVTRFAPLVKAGGAVLDLAAGHGRHARHFAALGHPVVALDRDAEALATLQDVAGIETQCIDLEGERARWPFAPAQFAGIVVTNYLYRPLFPALLNVLDGGGVLIYETFMLGNERHGRPSNPDFLLEPHELLQRVWGVLDVVAFEQGEVTTPKPAVVQRICAVRDSAPRPLQGG